MTEKNKNGLIVKIKNFVNLHESLKTLIAHRKRDKLVSKSLLKYITSERASNAGSIEVLTHFEPVNSCKMS